MAFMDVDLSLLVLRLAFVGLLYLFLYQVVLALRRDLRQSVSAPPSPRPALAQLVVVESEQPDMAVGHQLDLLPSTTIGRGPQNRIVLDDSFVSANHSLITLRSKRWWIEDLGSTNGTFVNRRRIHEATPVDHGDIVEIGRTKFKIAR